MKTTARILIVDEDVRVRRGLRSLIDAQGDMTVVAEAATAAEALELAVVLQPAVIVLDLIRTPGQRDAATPVLLMLHGWACVVTSWQSTLRGATLGMGARAFVEKGAPPASVIAAVRAAMGARGTVPMSSTSTPLRNGGE